MILYFYVILVCYVPLLSPFLPVMDLGSGLPNIDISRVVFLLLFFPVIFLFALRKIHLNFFHPWIIVLLLHFLYVLASIAWSERSYSISHIQVIFDVYFTPILVAILGLSLFQDDKALKRFIFHMSICLIAMTLISVYQFNVSPKEVISPTMRSIRASGTLGNANLMAIFFALNIPAFLYLSDKGLISNKNLILLLIFIAVGILVTISRKGIIIAFLGPGLYYFFTKNYKKIFLISIFVTAFSFFAMSHTMLSQRFDRGEMEEQLTDRFTVFYAGFEMLKKNVVMGMGYRGFYDNYGKYVPGQPKDRKYSPHNIFIDALTNYGLLGFPVFMLIFMIPLKRAVSAIFRGQKDIDLRLKGSMCIATLIPFMVSGFFAGGLFEARPAIYLLYTYLAFFFSASMNSMQDEKQA